MVKYILKRLVYVVVVFVILSFLMFMLYKLIPGDVVRQMLEPQRDKLTAEQYESEYNRLTASLGLDKPLVVQYYNWFTNLLKGNLGYSTTYLKDVSKIIGEPLLNTLFLNAFSSILALGITIPLGIYCAVKKKSFIDNAMQVFTILGISIPIYITALVMIYLFAVLIPIFPVSGMKAPGSTLTGFEGFIEKVYYFTLPVLVATINSMASTFRYIRAAMINELSQDYIRTARAKGVREKVVIYSHAWRNALLPVITIIISWFTSLLGGWVMLETMFGLNGIGKLMILGLTQQDYQMVLAMQMIYVIIALLGRLLTDLSYGLVDPRVRVDK
ncbi:MAG: ABC transporter permease [Clostridiales bacterium]|nr:ABC transporter permease [Clostridiales bacterium]MDY5754519.1 ABC transporter permease [Eubacteriales bacterium]